MFKFEYKELDFAHKLDNATSPEDQYTKHMHAFVEILFFVSGQVTYNVEGEKRVLKPGDCVLIQPGKLHFAQVNHDILYERYVLKFPEKFIPKHMKSFFLHSTPFFRISQDGTNLFKSLDIYYQMVNDEDMEIICFSKLMELFVLLKNSHEKEQSYDRSSVVTEITEYIQNHLCENLSLSKISKDLSYSESYISSYFKKEMHTPIMKYIRTKKIIYAHSLISEGAKPYEVCEKLNFNDYSTFYRQYLKVVGVAPSSHPKKK